MRHHNRIVMPA